MLTIALLRVARVRPTTTDLRGYRTIHDFDFDFDRRRRRRNFVEMTDSERRDERECWGYPRLVLSFCGNQHNDERWVLLSNGGMGL